MKKTKLIFSVIMAAVMICVSVVPAFAMTDIEIKRDQLNVDLEDWYYTYIGTFMEAGGGACLPLYSDHSTTVMEETIQKIKDECYTYTTDEEFDAAYALMEETKNQMCVSATEVEWLINYMARDYDSTDYYDEETTLKIKSIYEEAQLAVVSEDEQRIHRAYINMRNLLDELCVYNKVIGDVDKSGKLNIADVAEMQLDLAQLNKEKFTSSQIFIAGFYSNTTILGVSGWQLALAKLNDYEAYYSRVQERIDNLSAFKGIDINTRTFFADDEEYELHHDTEYKQRVNEMYSEDRFDIFRQGSYTEE